jgi:hypothetical protein
MRAELRKVKPPYIGITSLAIGADQLLAKLVLEEGGSIHAVLPYADIERSFSQEDLPIYRNLLARATTEVLDGHASDKDAYLAAGHRVVDLSDLVFSVWDGMPAKGKGGTADVVRYAKERGVPLINFNPVAETVERS